MKITMLGTGNASVKNCYNTCFAIQDNNKYLLVDGGGGNGIFHQLDAAGIDLMDIHDIFVTHKHLDHLLGIIWIVRMICQNMSSGKYKGDAYIYSHSEVIGLIDSISRELIKAKDTAHIGERLHLVTLEDGDEFTACGHRVKAFDIMSTKAKQFGFTMYYGEDESWSAADAADVADAVDVNAEGSGNVDNCETEEAKQCLKLTCLGDEPYYENSREYAEGSEWLMHEAFCMFSEADRFKPYEKNHSTVKDACQLAEGLGVKNLILYHTAENELETRKERYTGEGQAYYSGNLWVPGDLEVIEI